MVAKKLVLWAMLIGSHNSLVCNAAAQERSVFERVGEAYQVDRLIAAKTIRLELEHRSEFANHDFGPDFHETSYQRRHYVLDIHKQRGSSESVAEIASTYFHTRRIINDGKSVMIVYGPGIYQKERNRTFFSQFGPTIRGSDPMLAIWLVQSAESSRIEEDEVWMGRAHDKVTIDFPESPPLTILVDKETGYISRMTRIAGGNTKVSYMFDRHRVQNGIPIATENYVYGGRQKLVYTFGHRIILDDAKDRTVFEIDEDIVKSPKRIDQSAETIDQITETIYHTGQGTAYSTFIITDDGLIAYGLARGFSKRLETFRSKTGDISPLRFGVVTDHHQIELGGVADAVQQGATILITSDSEERTREVTKDLENANIEIVDTLKNIGTLKIIPISTSHASKALVGYDSQGQILTQKGHWVKWFESEPIWADISDLTLYEALKPYDLQINGILSTDGRGTGNWATFVRQVKAYEPIACHGNRPICKNWR